jgi:hypothetical protein
MNQMLQNFLRKQERDAITPDKPNPKVKEKDKATSLSMIIETKPSSKKVLEYIKERLNKLYSNPDDFD